MNNKGIAVLAAIIIIAAIAVVGVVVISNNSSTGPEIDYSTIPQSRGEDGAFILGDPNAPVTLIEFADFVCPHCVTYEATVSQFIKDYVATGQAKLEYRMFPTAGGDMTRFAGQIAECADDQRPGAFWEAYALLYDMARNGQYNQELGQRVANCAQPQLCRTVELLDDRAASGDGRGVWPRAGCSGNAGCACSLRRRSGPVDRPQRPAD